MEEKGYCNLRMSTVSRFGQTRHMQFGDFLKYSKNDLVGEKPEVVVETVDQEIKLKNMQVINWPNNKEPKPPLRVRSLGDAARIGYYEKARRPVLDLHLSSDLRAVIKDDIKAVLPQFCDLFRFYAHLSRNRRCRDLRTLSGKFLRWKSCYPESFCFF